MLETGRSGIGLLWFGDQETDFLFLLLNTNTMANTQMDAERRRRRMPMVAPTPARTVLIETPELFVGAMVVDDCLEVSCEVEERSLVGEE